jgi:poly-gamma-glutamate capsule biosynthesis protein CapA/YwtB (metallophosphatase superfamily)
LEESTVSLLFTGDLILDEPDPDFFFDFVRPTLLKADLVAGHVEVPHTRRGRESSSDVPAPPANPDHLHALGRAGFHVATLAGNHIFDSGPNGVEDTIRELRAQGLATTGAGANLEAARQPAVVCRKDQRVGFLSYNCVGPKDSWAAASKPGCAYVEIITQYELGYATPGGPPSRILTFAEPETLEQVQCDIEALRSNVDVLVVALHKGLGHTPAKLAGYERPVAKACIDAGADVVVGHHGHILQGVEVYRGKPIFHGLGNFVTVTRALNLEANPSPARLDWAKRRRELFGFEPDPSYPVYPFHPEAKNAMIASVRIGADRRIEAGFLPCWIRPSGQPEVLEHDERGIAVAAYVEKITRACKLRAEFHWQEDRVVFDA